MAARLTALPGVCAVLLLAGCQATVPARACRIEGPPQRVPAAVHALQLGMSKAEVERRLGAADYSPAEGQYYFGTGGDCPLGDQGHQAACGVVADFRRAGRGSDALLAACWWGAIGE